MLALTLSVALAVAATPFPEPASIRWNRGAIPVDDIVVRLQHPDPRTERAVARFAATVGQKTGVSALDGRRTLVIDCQPSAEWPTPDANESYTLTVRTTGIHLDAPDCRGALHGLNTLAQLAIDDQGRWVFPAVEIRDAPRFAWRGLLLDPARHFLSVDAIERTLDLMAVSKLNVLHWHLTDDQGFRLESQRYPLLHLRGSPDGRWYTAADVDAVVRYAADRGIRVVPEIDVPGHVSSWLVGYPDLASLPDAYPTVRRFGPIAACLDPTREEVYAFVHDLFAEWAPRFPDPYWHLGGDEVTGVHWDLNPRIGAFRDRHGLPDNAALQAQFARRVADDLRGLGKIAVGWDEIEAAAAGTDTVVEVYQHEHDTGAAAKQGVRLLIARGYYLDLNWTAAEHYAVDPTEGVASEFHGQILGGEAALWGEFVTEENLDVRLWPRAAAVAERLWSRASTSELYPRLTAFEEHLLREGSQHRSAQRAMLARLAGPADVAPVQRIAGWVAPVRNYGRGVWRSYEPWKKRVFQGYTTDTPLVRLVDAVSPDNAEARALDAEVDAALGGDTQAKSLLRLRFEEWRATHQAFLHTSEHARLLWEVEPITAHVDQLAAIGLRVLAGDCAAAEALDALPAQPAPGTELLVVIDPPVRRLVSGMCRGEVR